MSEMVEKVARKLEPQAWAALRTGDTLAYANRRKSSLRKARLAIEALRDPTEGMTDAAYAKSLGPPSPMPADFPKLNDAIFRAMIDAALV